MTPTMRLFIWGGILGLLSLLSLRARASEDLSEEQARQIVQNLSKGKLALVNARDLHGHYPYAYGDFNGDGLFDAAFAAVTKQPPRRGVFLIATHAPSGWRSAYRLSLRDRPYPFVQAGGMDQSLEIGAFRSDRQAITVFWDAASKAYLHSSAD